MSKIQRNSDLTFFSLASVLVELKAIEQYVLDTNTGKQMS
jgi:hypothetical protein